MLAQQVTLYPEWKVLYGGFKDSDYGSIIFHERIEEIVGYKRGPKYYAIVNRWKKEMLREASRHIECINKTGYQIVKPELFRASAKKQLKLGHKRMRKAGEIAVNTPLHLVSDEEKVKIGDFGIILSQILNFSKETMKQVRAIDKKTDKIMLDVGKALDLAD